MKWNLGKHAAGGAVFLFVFICASFFTGFGNNEAFDSNAWLSSNARDRGRMAQHLVDEGTLLGKDCDEVKETLGPPDRNYGKAFEYRINLGWPMKNPNTYGLQVHFDRDRNVRLVKIVD